MLAKDIHTTITNIIGFTLIGILISSLFTPWWSCSTDSLDYLRTWVLGTVLFGCGFLATLVGRHFKMGVQLNYYVELLLRFLLIYSMFTTALLKAEGHFYNYTLFDGVTKLADLEANSFANAFYGFSPSFQAYIGYIIIGALGMIAFRGTQRIGTVVLSAVLLNAVIINTSFESCYVYKNSIYLAVVVFFILNDIHGYKQFFGRSNTTTAESYHPLESQAHLHQSAILMKGILLVGMYFYNLDYIQDTINYRSRNVNSPITGIWNIQDIKYLNDTMPLESRKELESFKSIILDKGRYGAVEVADSLSFFEYIIIPDDNHLEIWNFQDYYDLDIKGTYTQITQDSMIYVGRNRSDSLIISLKKEILDTK